MIRTIKNIKNNYKDIKRIIGPVFKAKNIKNGKIVVIKIILRVMLDENDDLRLDINNKKDQKYVSEQAKIMESLSSEYIVQTNSVFIAPYNYDDKTFEGIDQFWMEMEYIPNSYTLWQLIEYAGEKNIKIDQDCIRIFLIAILRGFSYLIKHNYIHTDVHGGNIIFNEQGMKIIDVDSISKKNDVYKESNVGMLIEDMIRLILDPSINDSSELEEDYPGILFEKSVLSKLLKEKGIKNNIIDVISEILFGNKSKVTLPVLLRGTGVIDYKKLITILLD